MNSISRKWKEMPIEAKISIAYTLCNVVQQGISFLTLPLFTRLLTQSQYGVVTIYSSWQGILSIFLTLNLAYGSFSKAMVKYENERDSYIASVQGICIFLSALFFAIYLPFRGIFNKLLELSTPIVVVMVFELLAKTAVLLWNGKKRFEYRYKEVIYVTLAISFLSPVVAVFMVNSSVNKGDARIVGYAVVAVFFGGIIFINNIIKGRSIYQKEYWKYALGFNLPLLAYYLSQVVFNQSDRIMISHMKGPEKAAIYGVAYTMAMAMIIVLNSINNAYIPWLYERIKRNKLEDNKKVSNIIAIIMAIMILLVVWLAPEIMLVVGGKEYEEAKYVIIPIAISLLLLMYAQFFINIQFYFEEKYSLVISSIGAAVVNIVLNYFYIPKYDYFAAGYTTLISYFLFATINYLYLHRTARKYGLKAKIFDMKSLVLIFLISCLFSRIGVLLYNYILVRFMVIITVSTILFVKRKIIVSNYKRIKM